MGATGNATPPRRRDLRTLSPVFRELDTILGVLVDNPYLPVFLGLVSRITMAVVFLTVVACSIYLLSFAAS